LTRIARIFANGKSGQAPHSAANVQQQSRIAQHLQLLPYFIPDMPVKRIQAVWLLTPDLSFDLIERVQITVSTNPKI